MGTNSEASIRSTKGNSGSICAMASTISSFVSLRHRSRPTTLSAYSQAGSNSSFECFTPFASLLTTPTSFSNVSSAHVILNSSNLIHGNLNRFQDVFSVHEQTLSISILHRNCPQQLPAFDHHLHIIVMHAPLHGILD